VTDEPTSVLTYRDILIRVAEQLGVSYYGADGDEAAQVPVDTYDLDRCKRIVEDGMRMFQHDAPSGGWRTARVMATIDLWPSVAVDSDVTATSSYDPASNTTSVTSSEDAFYASMEGKTLSVTSADDFPIYRVDSATVLRLRGNVAWSGSSTFSIEANGNYTIPLYFSGSPMGTITYVGGSNNGVTMEWASPTHIRRLRSVVLSDSGDPCEAAVRRVSGNSRRWELMVYPPPNSVEQVEFPYEARFDVLEDLDDLHPFGFIHDEGVIAACKAVAERDGEDLVAGLTEYYQKKALPNCYRNDSGSAPRKIGSLGGSGRVNLTPWNFRTYQRRPTVTYDTP